VYRRSRYLFLSAPLNGKRQKHIEKVIKPSKLGELQKQDKKGVLTGYKKALVLRF